MKDFMAKVQRWMDLDVMVSWFTEWLISADGSKSQAKQGKDIVMSILRLKNYMTDYKYLAFPSLLNNFMAKLNEEKKKNQSLWKHLTLVKQFIHYCEAESSSRLKDQNILQVNVWIFLEKRYFMQSGTENAAQETTDCQGGFLNS